MRSFNKILEDFHSSTHMNTTIKVDSVSQVGQAWRCVVGLNAMQWLGKTTLSASPKLPIVGPGAITYLVSAVENDQWFEINVTDRNGVAVAQPQAGVWTCPKFNYVFGTPKAVNGELVRLDDQFPLIWLLEVMQEKFSQTRREDVLRPLSRIFFLCNADAVQYTNEDHLEKAVLPMRNYAHRLLLNMIQRSQYFSKPEDPPVFINQSRFGLNLNQPRNQDMLSHYANLFGAHVSGVELRLEIGCRPICYE